MRVSVRFLPRNRDTSRERLIWRETYFARDDRSIAWLKAATDQADNRVLLRGECHEQSARCEWLLTLSVSDDVRVSPDGWMDGWRRDLTTIRRDRNELVDE